MPSGKAVWAAYDAMADFALNMPMKATKRAGLLGKATRMKQALTPLIQEQLTREVREGEKATA